MHRHLALLFSLALLFVAAPLLAEDDGRERARPLALEGIELLEKGDAKGALGKLEEAERLFHAPTHLLYIARAKREIGDLLGAHATYVAILVEAIPNYAPQQFQEARQQAADEVAALRERVATVSIRVAGAEDAAVTIDGEVLAAESLAQPIAVSPGKHVIGASAGGLETSETIEAEVGETRQVELAFAPRNEEVTAVAPEEEPSGSFPVLATVLLVAGGGALIAGAVTGGLTLGKAGDIEDTCVDDVCPPEQEEAADDAKVLGNVSTAMFVAGGVLAATGIVLLIVDPFSSDDDDVAIRIELSPAGAAVAGSF
jgi:hypothetical protein